MRDIKNKLTSGKNTSNIQTRKGKSFGYQVLGFGAGGGAAAAFVAATGGTITTVDTNFKVHTFTGPGTFCVSCAGNEAGNNKVDYLVIAGGAGGGIGFGSGYCGGGGGAGGYRESKSAATSGCWSASPLATCASVEVTAQGYTIEVGNGGAGRSGCGGNSNGPNVAAGTNGVNSSGLGITSTGGGGGAGGGRDSKSVVGTGGSGGGGAYSNASPAGAGGAGNTPPVSPAQGFPGGDGPGGGNNSGGGGGGATDCGTNRSAPANGGPGGDGATNTINGSPVARAGGGGGSSLGPPIGASGAGGGGTGARYGPAANGVNGTANTGGGGGGGVNYSNGIGGNGGTGIVIIRYRFQQVNNMASFAKISEENLVISVLAFNDSDMLNADGVETETVGQQYLETHNNWPAHLWIQTSYNTRNNKYYNQDKFVTLADDQSKAFRGNFAGIGYTWDEDNNMFFPPKTFSSWVKDISTASWKSPLGYPPELTEEQIADENNEYFYNWNESGQSWDLVTIPIIL